MLIQKCISLSRPSQPGMREKLFHPFISSLSRDDIVQLRCSLVQNRRYHVCLSNRFEQLVKIKKRGQQESCRCWDGNDLRALRLRVENPEIILMLTVVRHISAPTAVDVALHLHFGSSLYTFSQSKGKNKNEKIKNYASSALCSAQEQKIRITYSLIVNTWILVEYHLLM